MNPLSGRKILLAVTGGIAAYKAALLARELLAAGADVRVVMTAGAQAFVQPLTFQALTGRAVHTDLLDPAAEAAMGHIELARWADRIVIAPASANTLAGLAHGLANDLLGTLCLATDAPLSVAPAMNRLMWANPATSANCATLRKRGVHFIGPATGDQACGEVGAGRMSEPADIITALMTAEAGPEDTSLSGLQLIITAGPTREPIDPVRYIGNRSSGKMGFAIAAEAVRRGAAVTLVAGPVSLETPAGVTRIDVDTAQQMHDAVMQRVAGTDVFVAVAAVADYRVADIGTQKIKKHGGDVPQLRLVPNPDILDDVSARPDRPFCVGFAAETEHLQTHAMDKLARKRLDLIAANRVADVQAPVFGSDDNALELYWPDGGHRSIARANKDAIAAALLDVVAERLAGG